VKFTGEMSLIAIARGIGDLRERGSGRKDLMGGKAKTQIPNVIADGYPDDASEFSSDERGMPLDGTGDVMKGQRLSVTRFDELDRLRQPRGRPKRSLHRYPSEDRDQGQKESLESDLRDVVSDGELIQDPRRDVPDDERRRLGGNHPRGKSLHVSPTSGIGHVDDHGTNGTLAHLETIDAGRTEERGAPAKSPNRSSHDFLDDALAENEYLGQGVNVPERPEAGRNRDLPHGEPLHLDLVDTSANYPTQGGASRLRILGGSGLQELCPRFPHGGVNDPPSGRV